jgi:hypothetical protein
MRRIVYERDAWLFLRRWGGIPKEGGENLFIYLLARRKTVARLFWRMDQGPCYYVFG